MKSRVLLAVFLTLAVPRWALAYGVPMDIGNLGRIDFTTTMNRIQWANVQRNQERLNSGNAGAQASTRFTASPAGSSQAKSMAATYPAAGRADAEKAFNAMLQGYAKIEQRFGVPRHDLAGAVAAFFAGSYMAYRNADFPDEHFNPLVAQMRQMMASDPEFAKANHADRQQMYEQMAILGMFMATTQMALKSQPDPRVAAELRSVGKGYLERFFKADADRIQLTAQGLVVR